MNKLVLDPNAPEALWLLGECDAAEAPRVIVELVQNRVQGPVGLNDEEADEVRGWLGAARGLGHTTHGVRLLDEA